MASPFPVRAGITGLTYSNSGLDATDSPSAVTNLEMGHSPALVTHVQRHDSQSFCLELAGGSRMRAAFAVRPRWKDESFAVQIRPDQEHGPAHGVKLHQVAFVAHVI